MVVNISKRQKEIWDSGVFEAESKGLSFSEKCDFYRKKAIKECGLLKKGVFVNLISHFGGVWIEVDKVREDSNFMHLAPSYDSGRLQSVCNIHSIATEIKSLPYPQKPYVVYTKEKKYGTKKGGLPISQFFNEPQ